MGRVLAALLLPLALFAQQITAILAAQWFESVCAVKHYKECRKKDPFWQNHFTLHGLWPQSGSYCNISARAKLLDKKGTWRSIDLPISPLLAQLLPTYMPGYYSHLHKHEWVKHGSCYGHPDHYFFDAIALLSQLNDSQVRLFFLRNRGKRIQTYKIRQAFDKAFGKGAGKRVKVICQKGYITELRISLRGELFAQTPLADLIHSAPPLSLGCKRGRIAR